MAISANDTVVVGVGASVNDGNENVWAIDSNGQITVNGQVDGTTANVDLLAFDGGLVWQKNADNNWYSKTAPSAAWVQWPGPGAPVTTADVSANDASVAVGSLATLVDANGNVWGLAKVNGANGYQVTVDGAVDATTANLVQLALVDGTIWQQNTAGLWYSKTTPASGWSQSTPIDPITGSAQPVTLTWVGGGGNRAGNPADWSPALKPQPGNSLVMGSGTMSLSGHALAGDTLMVRPGAAVAIDTTGNATLDLATREPGETIAINADPAATLRLTADLSGAETHISGGTIAFIGTSTFAAFQTVLSDNLTGTGTLQLFGGNASGEAMEVNGRVGHGLTFDISSGPIGDAGLQVDQPAAFHAAVNLQAAGYLSFSGLQATRGELLNGILKLFDGNTLVQSTRFSDTANAADFGALQLEQTSAGVAVSVGTGGEHFQPGGPGTVLPLTT